jgi:hypothetical protein
MATRDLTADVLKTPLSLLGVAGDIPPGSWGSQSTDAVAGYGERLEDIGCDQDTIDQINQGAAALLDFRDAAAPDGVQFDDKALLRFGTDKNGGLTSVAAPVVKAKEGEVVLVLGNTALPVGEADGVYTVGKLTGALKTIEVKGYTQFRIQFQDSDSGDRYRVKAYTREGVTEDDVLDGIAEGKSLSEFLVEAGGNGGGGGMSMNMDQLPIGDFRVLGTTRRTGKDGKPDWFTIKVEGYDQEVKSRSATDLALKAGFNAEAAHAKGKVCVLSITSKTPFGEGGKVQIGCSLSALPPEKAEPRLKATAERTLEKAVSAPAAERPAPKAAPAPAAAPAAAPSNGANLAAKAAAARKKQAAVAAVEADEDSDDDVSVEF